MLRSGSILLVCLLSYASALEPLRAPADPFFVSPPGLRPDENAPPPTEVVGDLEFSLRHIYHRGAHQHPNVHRYLDVSPETALLVADDVTNSQIQVPGVLKARAVSLNVNRMKDRSAATIERLRDHAAEFGQPQALSASDWSIDSISGPDVTNKSTVISLAWMAANAYVEVPRTGDWKDVGGGFNDTDDFGWEGDGLRGHIFATKDNSTIIIGLKGTSLRYLDGSDTSEKDKINDNLFASCCCGQQSSVWVRQACDCKTDTYTCNNTCVTRELRQKDRYYQAATDLYRNVTERYPKAEVWLSGHSLGGVVSSLLGLTYGLPVVTFEAYPDALAASRLGLPVPPGYRAGAHQSRTDVAIHHFGHTADPIYTGDCHGFPSMCAFWGFAFESYCHTGKRCQYDTVADKQWRQGIAYHRILSVIRDILEVYDEPASCTEALECTDCYLWKYYESNSSQITTTSSGSSKTYTRTRTETCETPGWWGCLDETTTTSPQTTSTMTTTTSTCKTPGWFGCRDSTTTTITSTITKPATGPALTSVTSTTTTLSSSTCLHPGWLGCNDPTTTPKPSITASSSSSSLSSSSTTPATKSHTDCSSKIWFGLICADPTTTSAVPSSTPSSPPNRRRKECLSRYWFGWCKEWRSEPVDDSNDQKTDL